MDSESIRGRDNLTLAIMRAIFKAKDEANEEGIHSDEELPEAGGFSVHIAYQGEGEWRVEAAFEEEARYTIGGDAAPYWRDPDAAAEAILDWYETDWIEGYMPPEVEDAEAYGLSGGPDIGLNDLAPTVYRDQGRYFAVVRELGPGLPLKTAQELPREVALEYARFPDEGEAITRDGKGQMERSVALLRHLGLVSEPEEA